MQDPIDEHPMRQHVAMLLGQYPYAAPSDPVVYRLSLAAILEAYPEDAVQALIHPVHGFVAERSDRRALPETKEVKDWLDRYAARAARLAQYRALPGAEQRRLPPPPRRKEPGMYANWFVAEGAPQYERCVEWSKLPDADPLCWKMGTLHGRNGIWVSLNVFDDLFPFRGMRRPPIVTRDTTPSGEQP